MSTNRVSPQPPKESSSHSSESPRPTTSQQKHTRSEENKMGGKWQQLLSSICSRLDYGARKEIDLQNEILDWCFGSMTKQEIQAQTSSGSSNTANDNMCSSFHVNKPLVLLYLSQNSVPFIRFNRSTRKKNAFERILASCVFTEDVWIFTHAQTKDYFKKFKDEWKPKNSSFFFFFYTDFENTKQSLQEISEDIDAFLIFLVKDQEETFYNSSDGKTSVIVIEDSGRTEAQEDDCSPDSCKVFDISINITAKNPLCELILDIMDEKKWPVQKYLQLALSWDCSEKAQPKLESWDISEKKLEKVEEEKCSMLLQPTPLKAFEAVTEEGLQPGNEGQAEDKAEDLYDLMEKALIEDRFEVVRIFLMKGVKISSFLEKHKANLYLKSEENDLFKKLEDATRDNKQGQDKIKKYVEHLLDDFAKENKPSSHKKQPEHQEVAKAKETRPKDERSAEHKCSVLYCVRSPPKPGEAPISVTDKKQAEHQEVAKDKETQPKNEGPTEDKDKQTDPAEPELFLFLWALLTMKFDLAKVLLDEVKDKITTPLVSCALLKAIQNRTMDDVNFQDEQEDINQNIGEDYGNGWLTISVEAKDVLTRREFEELAIKALNTLYEKNQNRTYTLLKTKQKTDYWSNVTWWEIAEHARCRKFIAQEACQKFADVIWEGRLSLYGSDNERRQENQVPKDKSKASTKSVIFTRAVYFICAIFVIIPKSCMDFSHNKRGQAQLKHALVQLVYTWPRDFSNPSFKFYSRWFLFNGFLLLYAYVLMVRVPVNDVQPSEIVLMIWFISLYIDELHVSFKMVRPRKNPCVAMLLLQLSILNVTNYYLGFIGIIVWFCGSNDTFLHIILCLNFVGFIVRFFHFLTINSKLGPKIFMIKRMIMEIILFFVIFLILFITYGIIKYSIDNQGEGVVNSTVVLDLPVEAFWLMMGDRPDDGDANDDDPKVIFRGIVRVAYLMFTAILLINVLIAAFNSLYERTNKQKQDVRKFQKFQTIVKYSNASVYPPPFNVFYLAWCLINCKGQDSENLNVDQDDFKMDMKDEDKDKLLKWAEVTMESPKEETHKSIQEIVKDTLDKYYYKRRLEKEKRKFKEDPANQGKGSGESSPPPQNQVAKDIENPSAPIKALTKLNGPQSDNLKNMDKLVKSAHYHAAEDAENLSRPIDELTRHAKSHSRRLEDVVNSLKQAKTQAAKDTENLSRLVTELKDLLKSHSESCENGVNVVESAQPQATKDTENLSGPTEKIIVLVESLSKRLEDVVQMLQRTETQSVTNTAALSLPTTPRSHDESPRPPTKRRPAVCETCASYGSCIVCGRLLKLTPTLVSPKTTKAVTEGAITEKA